MIKPILIWPNPGLKVKSFEVEPEEFGTDGFTQLITDMWDTLFDSGGVGLSAIQIGVPKRVFVMDIGKRSLVFCNPIIIKTEGEQAYMNEGCLSLPGIIETILRWPAVTVQALDDKGQLFQTSFKGLEGQCIQHENDHLDGILMPDKLEPIARERLRKKMAKLAKEKP